MALPQDAVDWLWQIMIILTYLLLLNISTYFAVQTPGSSTPAYSPYMFRCERLEPVPDDAKYTLPKEILDETTEESLTTTRKPLPSGDQPMNDTGILGPAGKFNINLTSYCKFSKISNT